MLRFPLKRAVYTFFASICMLAVLLFSSYWRYEAVAAENPKPGNAQDNHKKSEGSAPSLGQGLVRRDVPLHIASDRMDANQKDRTIVFEGHVVVQQDNMTITGKRMKVYGSAQRSSGKQAKGDPNAKGDAPASSSAMMDQIERIDMEGDVRIVQDDKVATADKAEYFHQEQKIVLLGNPQVRQGQDSVQGRVITLFIAEERSVVEGAESTPVQAVLYPKKKDKAQ